MARITVHIEPRHADNSRCEHAVKPSGRPRDPESGCTGRTAYAVVCSEHGDGRRARDEKDVERPVHGRLRGAEKKHKELQAHCRALEARLQLYATTLNLLSLENAALSGRDADAAKVRAMPRQPQHMP
jgi:hypothetical protein